MNPFVNNFYEVQARRTFFEKFFYGQIKPGNGFMSYAESYRFRPIALRARSKRFRGARETGKNYRFLPTGRIVGEKLPTFRI
jgi:hypothetical protein